MSTRTTASIYPTQSKGETLTMQEPAKTLQEVAELLAISPQTVSRLIKRGEFPGAFRVGNAPNAPWRIPQKDIINFIQRNTIDTGDQD